MVDDKRDSTAMEWIARSMGYVDTLCCYSYSKEQIESEGDACIEANARSTLRPPDWMYEDYDDDSIVVKEKPKEKQKSHKRPQKRSNFDEDESRGEKYRHMYLTPGSSPARSVSTATTFTTSTASTVRTSTRSPVSLYREKMKTAPREISLPGPGNHSVERPIQMRPVSSNALAGVPFYSSTEGYQC